MEYDDDKPMPVAANGRKHYEQYFSSNGSNVMDSETQGIYVFGGNNQSEVNRSSNNQPNNNQSNNNQSNNNQSINNQAYQPINIFSNNNQSNPSTIQAYQPINVFSNNNTNKNNSPPPPPPPQNQWEPSPPTRDTKSPPKCQPIAIDKPERRHRSTRENKEREEIRIQQQSYPKLPGEYRQIFGVGYNGVSETYSTNVGQLRKETGSLGTTTTTLEDAPNPGNTGHGKRPSVNMHGEERKKRKSGRSTPPREGTQSRSIHSSGFGDGGGGGGGIGQQIDNSFGLGGKVSGPFRCNSNDKFGKRHRCKNCGGVYSLAFNSQNGDVKFCRYVWTSWAFGGFFVCVWFSLFVVVF